MSIVRGKRRRIRLRATPSCRWCGELITYKRHPQTKQDRYGNPIPDWDVRARWTTDHRCIKRPPVIRSSVGTGPDQVENRGSRPADA